MNNRIAHLNYCKSRVQGHIVQPGGPWGLGRGGFDYVIQRTAAVCDRHRQPHRKNDRGSDPERHDQGSRPSGPEGLPGGLRPDDLRPRVHEHGLLQEQDHVHRRGQGHPGVPRIPDRGARREDDVPRDGVSRPQRGAADQAAADRLGEGRHVPHDGPREHQGPDGGLPVRRAPHGDARVHGRRAVHVLSGSQGRSFARDPAAADRAPGREDADAGRLRLPPLDRLPVRVPGQRPVVHRATSCR